MAVRLRIQSIEAQPSALSLFRDAFARLKSQGDDRGFDFFASLHGLALPFWCEHGSPLFLPWHRAYLYYFELALQTRLGPRFTEITPQVQEFAEIGLPWWDWASPQAHSVGLPPSYAEAEVDGVANPLHATEVAACPGQGAVTGIWAAPLVELVRQQLPGVISATGAPVTQRDPDAPDELPTQATLDTLVLTQSTYGDFNTSLEQVHGDVHVWVGGAMSQVPAAAYDPIFWSHHAMIDRLWYLWQNSALGRDPPPDLLNAVLAPFPMTVAQVLEIDRLNYGYAMAAVA
ncbi:tyrosinase family protein [Roseovarius aestuariivivens]|uniref:tyrosinase family protein n=1 Tax=Roseovarius aestuariivivens TaxID=1888910 RepID=UPI00108220B4|nr:tyrosinase family protein [Roseovarius aestuariivivens]